MYQSFVLHLTGYTILFISGWSETCMLPPCGVILSGHLNFIGLLLYRLDHTAGLTSQPLGEEEVLEVEVMGVSGGSWRGISLGVTTHRLEHHCSRHQYMLASRVCVLLIELYIYN